MDDTTVTFNEYQSQSSEGEEYLLTERREDKGLSLDMNMISCLKAHITNPDLYNLSHLGFRKKDQMKTQIIKEIE